MDKIYCLYFDDKISDSREPFGAFFLLLENELRKNVEISIKKVDDRQTAEKEMREFRYDIIFLDIRINPDKGGNLESYPWERTGIGIIKNIRVGEYENLKSGNSTHRNVPIIVITAVADTEAQEEIIKIGRGGNNKYKLALLEKPSSPDDVAKKVIDFLS